MKSYGSTPIQRNWNRLAELTQHWRECDKAEIDYRVAVQNYYANHGEMPADFADPDDRRIITRRR